ncbi:MAG: hypothetical protein ACAH11_10315 [Sphingomonas sp.]
MRIMISALIGAGLCLAQPTYAASAPDAAPAQQDADYQAMLRCYGFHFFKIELGTKINNTEIAQAGRDQSQLDLDALRVYAGKKGLAWADVQAAADASAKARRAIYIDPKNRDTLMGDQDYCSSDAFVRVLLQYQQ